MDDEVWLPIPGWELYEVSSHGRVKSLARTVHYPDGRRSYVRPERLLGWQTRGYSRVVLVEPQHDKREAFVHDLVLEAFVGPCPNGLIALHADDDKQNNYLHNLRWGTYSDNMHDRVRNGIHHAANKTHCKRGHLFDETNTLVSQRGHRHCRECVRMHGREHARRKHGHKPRVYRANMTECRHGHPITAANTYTNPNTGDQACRTCRAKTKQVPR